VTPFTFALSAALLLLMPGPTNTLLAAGGATAGFRRAALLPLAEALGYAIAISAFVAAAAAIQAIPAATAAMKLLAAAWLLYSACRLWAARAEPLGGEIGFIRVMATTILNPKAMLVGTTMIPVAGLAAAAPWIAGYVLMSTTAGLAWVAFGSMLPAALRRHATAAAAVVLAGFSAIAASAALS
jgi:threonine/homoserine/homoserine lactone efflux protein